MKLCSLTQVVQNAQKKPIGNKSDSEWKRIGKDLKT